MHQPYSRSPFSRYHVLSIISSYIITNAQMVGNGIKLFFELRE